MVDAAREVAQEVASLSRRFAIEDEAEGLGKEDGMRRIVLVLALALMVLPAVLPTVAQAQGGKFIPLWWDDQLVTSLLPRGAEPGQPGFIPLPEAQSQSSNDDFYVIRNNEQQMVTPEVIEHVPGDPGYTGGRWNVMFVDFVNEADEVNVTSVEQIHALETAGKVMITDAGVSFVCPVTSLTFDG